MRRRLPAPLRAVLVAVAAAVVLSCAGAPVARAPAGQLTNPYLGPGWSSWLVGPIAAMATPAERSAFLELREDEAAAAFAEDFWQRRDPDPAEPGNPVRELFEERALLADRRFSEAGYLGRRTDRGTIFVLFGEPDSIGFELARREGEPPIELWDYQRATAPGLHGRSPLPQYRFIRRGDLTEQYRSELPRRETAVPPRP